MLRLFVAAAALSASGANVALTQTQLPTKVSVTASSARPAMLDAQKRGWFERAVGNMLEGAAQTPNATHGDKRS